MKRLMIIGLLFTGFFMTACGTEQSGQDPNRAARLNEDIYHGDSISELCDIYVQGLNRAVSGHTSKDLLVLVEYFITIDAPAKYHILIGTNDIKQGIEDTYVARLNSMLALLKGEVIITSILPTSNAIKNEKIITMNADAKALTKHWGHSFRDVYNDFTGPDGLLKAEYTFDGLHLTATGCKALFQ